MLTTATIENLNPEDFALLEADDVTKPETLARTEELVNDADADQEAGDARDLLEALDALVTTHQETLKSNPGVLAQYTKLLWNLRWKALAALTPQNQNELLSDHLLFSLRHGIDVKVWLGSMMRTLEFGTYPNSRARQRLLAALNENRETLGKQNISLGGETSVQPSLQNWLRDYSDAVQRDPQGTLTQNTYMQTSRNVQALEEGERQLLEKVVALFTWLKYPQLSGEFITKEEANKQKGVIAQPSTQQPQTTPQAPQVATQQPPLQESAAAEPTQPSSPQETVGPLDAAQLQQELSRITKDHDLHVDEAASLQDEIASVLDGRIHPNDFAERMHANLHTVPEEKFGPLIQDVDESVFKPIRSVLIARSETPQPEVPTQTQGVPTFEQSIEEQAPLESVKEKLEQNIHTEAEEKQVAGNSVGYKGTDPYREPIE